MPRLKKEFKEQIKKLETSVLQEIVLKLASKEKLVYEYILANYLDKEGGEQMLFEKTKSDLDFLFIKNYKGYSDQLRYTNMLAACIKRINEFTKISKNKVLEADLLVYVLKIPFSMPKDFFGTCFTTYDTKVALILKRLINIVSNKLHEDYRIEYETKINNFLKKIHETSNHIDTIYFMPQKLSDD